MKNSYLKITSLTGLMLIASGCSSLGKSEDPASFVFDRLVEECDGNLLIASGDYIREVKDFKIETQETETAANEAAKLNNPDFIKNITRTYSILGPVYRDRVPNNVGKWENLSSKQQAAGISISWSEFKNKKPYIYDIRPLGYSSSGLLTFDQMKDKGPNEESWKDFWNYYYTKGGDAQQECNLFVDTKTNLSEVFKGKDIFNKFAKLLTDSYYEAASSFTTLRADSPVTDGGADIKNEDFKLAPENFEQFRELLNSFGFSNAADQITKKFKANEARYESILTQQNIEAAAAVELANDASAAAGAGDAASAADAAATDQFDYR